MEGEILDDQEAENRLVTIGSTTTELDGEATLTFASNSMNFLADSSAITFGADSEITLTHVADKGLTLKHTATADDKPVILTLATGETTRRIYLDSTASTLMMGTAHRASIEFLRHYANTHSTVLGWTFYSDQLYLSRCFLLNILSILFQNLRKKKFHFQFQVTFLNQRDIHSRPNFQI